MTVVQISMIHSKAKLLAAYLAEPLPPFDWGSANCAHFAGTWVAMVEGSDPTQGLAATPTMQAARRLAAELGGMPAAVSATLKRDPIAPLLARLGDVVLLPLDPAHHEALALGICCGEQAAFVTEHGAAAFLPLSLATHAWRVGE